MGRPLIFTQAEAEQMRAMRLKGMSYTTIADAMYCDPVTVCNTLKHYGLDTPRVVKYSAELHERIRKLYLTGTKRRTIALMVGTDRSAVNNIIYNDVTYGRLPRRTKHANHA